MGCGQYPVVSNLDTRGTAQWLTAQGVASTLVNKVYEGRPNIVDRLKNNDIALVMNTTEGTQAVSDSRDIRRVALMDKIPYFTTAAASIAVVAAIIATLMGYVNFAKFVNQQLIGGSIVVLAATLLFKFVDDFSTWLLNADSKVGQTILLSTGLSVSRLEQAGVLLSAVLRTFVVLIALLALAAPFGNIGSVVERVASLANGISIGDITLKPARIAIALLVMLVGLGLTQLLQRWFGSADWRSAGIFVVAGVVALGLLVARNPMERGGDREFEARVPRVSLRVLLRGASGGDRLPGAARGIAATVR